jgi:hypothetical protein
VLEAGQRVDRITQALREQVMDWRLGQLVQALMCFKGTSILGMRLGLKTTLPDGYLSHEAVEAHPASPRFATAH